METQSKARTLWESKLKLRDAKTKARYIGEMDKFLKVNAIDSLEQLYLMRQDALQSKDKRDANHIENLVSDHFMWLQSDHPEFDHIAIKSQTCLQFVASIRHFFKSQNDELKIDIKEFEVSESIGRDVIQSSQLKQIWESVSDEFRLKTRAVIAIIKDSGIRVSDVAEITISEYNNAKLITDKLGNHFKVFAPKINEKKKVRMVIHLGDEAINAIELYLKVRKANNNDFLITNLEGNKISSNSITNTVRIVCEKVAPRLGGHSFRKFHYTTLLSSGMPEEFIKVLQGKKTSTYNKSLESGSLTLKYMECYNTLRIFKEKTQLEDQQTEINRLKAEMVKMKEIYEWKTEMADIIEELKAQEKTPQYVKNKKGVEVMLTDPKDAEKWKDTE